MSDLIKRIDGICVVFDRTSNVGEVMRMCKAEIERLSAVGEPVAYVTEPDLLGKRKWVTVTPPSVDALIAEIESVGVNNHMAIQAILDKYRSAK